MSRERRISDGALFAAVSQAVREGLLPAHASVEEYTANVERIRRVLDAAVTHPEFGEP